MPAEIVAREAELAAVRELIAGPFGVVVLEGEAGIGKTTLWTAGLGLALEAGQLVLQARPAQSEAQLSFAALGDLLEPHAEDLLPQLPAPRRRALEVALLLAEPVGNGVDARAVGAAITAGLRKLAERRPLLVAVDDIQWLDAASAAALAFALRRLAAESDIRVLLAERFGEPAHASLGLDRPPVEPYVRRLPVEGLSLAALQRLLNAHLGVSLTRPELRRVHEASGGNPFHALELVRAQGAEDVRERVEALVRRRMAALPESTRRALLLAALATASDFARLGTEAEVLAPAEAADIVTLEGGEARFRHPLYASGVVAAASPETRRAAHARLAEAATLPEEQARHLAGAAAGPDAAVAARLEDVAGELAARGAPAAAAQLAEEGARLTPAGAQDDACRRRTLAGFLAFVAGDSVRAQQMLEQTVAVAPPGPGRTRALARLARVLYQRGALRDAIRTYEQALAVAGDEPALLAELHEGAGWAYFFMREDMPGARDRAARAVELAEGLDDPVQLGDALSLLFQAELLLGDGVPEALVSRALEVGERARDVRVLRRPDFHVGLVLLCTDRLDAARERYARAEALAIEQGDESGLPFILMRMAHVELAAGRLARAAEVAEEGLELAIQIAHAPREASLVCTRALIAAQQGDEGARELAQRGFALAERYDDRIGRRLAVWALGHLELALGDPHAAVAQLEPLWRDSLAAGIREPGENRYAGDLIEALVAVGRQDDALAIAREFAALGERLDRPFARALAARGRGLVAAASGDHEAAVAMLEAALAEPVPLPLEVARSRLCLGTVLRRARRRRKARTALEAALAEFERLGARLWAERARAELGRIGGRAPASGQLTPAERAVAEHVARGRSNRETATALFVTDRTVEYHLSHIYAKLGVRSRAELAAQFHAET